MMRKQIAAMSVCLRLALATLLMPVAAPAQQLQQGRWASDDDPIAKQMIQMERDWAEAGCTQKAVVKELLADDFQGTAPGGERYSKAQALKRNPSRERGCRLDDAKVRFLATVSPPFMAESAPCVLRTDEDGKEAIRCLVWTDTCLKRRGKWEIVAAQDTGCRAIECRGNECILLSPHRPGISDVRVISIHSRHREQKFLR